MRFFAGLLAYRVGVSAFISIAIVGVMALKSPVDRTPAAPKALAASNKERPVDQAAQKKTKSDRKSKVVHTTHKRMHASPNTAVGGDAYGYAEAPRYRVDPNLFFTFGR